MTHRGPITVPDSLQTSFAGSLLLPDEPGYETARRVHNGAIGSGIRRRRSNSRWRRGQLGVIEGSGGALRAMVCTIMPPIDAPTRSAWPTPYASSTATPSAAMTNPYTVTESGVGSTRGGLDIVDALVAGGKHVIRYDNRDVGQTTCRLPQCRFQFSSGRR